MATVASLDARREASRSRQDPVQEVSTATLVARAGGGDRAASRMLYERFRSSLNQTAARLALSAADADDLVQEAFATAFDRLRYLRDPEAFGGWARSIVVRTAAKRLRRHRIARKLGLVEPAPVPFQLLSISQAAPAEAVLELERVYRALAHLPQDAGVALVLHRIEGLTLREIAEQMGVSEPTVKRRIRRALDAIGGAPCPE